MAGLLMKFALFSDWLAYDMNLFRCVKMRYLVNLNKAITIPLLLYFMRYYQNFSMGAMLYLALHGGYSLIWLIRAATIPDPAFDKKFSIVGLVMMIFVSILYYYFGFLMMSGAGDQNPSPEKCMWCVTVFLLGEILMITSSLQKTLCRNVRPSLVTNGLFSRIRHPNYLGEMVIYCSFVLLLNDTTAYYILGGVFAATFPLAMIVKEYRLSRFEGWTKYKSQTWVLLPKLIPTSTIATRAIYALLFAVSCSIWANGGIVGLLRSN